jgi:hypothetical protein
VRRVGLASALAWGLAFPGIANADLAVRIDKSAQRMTVLVDGEAKHSWPVSTGRAGFGTPNGSFRPQRLARQWFSRKYYNSPMPHSIFFHEGFAIHGTTELTRLGGPASHGCVRLHPGHAAALFALVQEHGRASTSIVVTGSNPTAIASRPSSRASFSAREPRELLPAPGRYGAPAYYDVYGRTPVYYVRVPVRGYYGYDRY